MCSVILCDTATHTNCLHIQTTILETTIPNYKLPLPLRALKQWRIVCRYTQLYVCASVSQAAPNSKAEARPSAEIVDVLAWQISKSGKHGKQKFDYGLPHCRHLINDPWSQIIFDFWVIIVCLFAHSLMGRVVVVVVMCLHNLLCVSHSLHKIVNGSQRSGSWIFIRVWRAIEGRNSSQELILLIRCPWNKRWLLIQLLQLLLWWFHCRWVSWS